MGFKLPKLPTMGGLVGDLQKGLIAAGVLAGTYMAANWVGRQAVRWVPPGVPGFLVKAGTALGVVYLSRMVVRDPGLRKVSTAGAFFPLTLEVVSMVAPGLAAQVVLPSVTGLPAPAAQAAGVLGMYPDSERMLGAELEAELETDTEMSLY